MPREGDRDVNNFGLIPLDEQVQSPIVKAIKFLGKIFDSPVTWFRVNVSEKFKGPSYPYYHKKFRPVTPISECYSDDMSCIYEAQSAYLRQKKVDFEILKIIKQRYYNCSYWERTINEFHDLDKICLKERQDLKDTEINLFIKYGELGPFATVIDAFMKQKHRLIWERRQIEGGQDMAAH
ncbi:NADH dehydrogenase (ubiquinone) PDSW subunit [Dermatophagoides farinae]|uniref:NADH dehydrogenase [ubiquinone] 1 beta subcomplex subunit 10 n=1 Tax=Dermatophagoides farinae TaxID=6954 RepID=A0A9D4SL55_DERFA|nr:NADH dehydrogenase [ubiquinone] 1 beta subcomplex subunit 10-like [Dermatophagoides farinae]KAH7646464.1 nadh dehydrogenase [Dermatophagoides farinae]